MTSILEAQTLRLAFFVCAIPVILLLQLWGVSWWATFLALGALGFCFTLRKPAQTFLPFACLGFAVSLLLLLTSILLAAHHKETLSQLREDASINRIAREIPNFATALLSYCFLLGARSFIQRRSKEDAR